MCEWGPHVEKLETIYRETGVRPTAYDRFPTLDASAHEMVNMFEQLSRSRFIGFTMNPIQMVEIRSYFELFGEPSIGVHAAVRLVNEMDAKFLEFKTK